MAEERLVGIILDECTKIFRDDDEAILSALESALSVHREKMKISPAKAGGGTSGEMWIAKSQGLIWEKSKVQGHDALDARGMPCEIKASIHPSKKKTDQKVNINYKSPPRIEGESDEAFLSRSEAKIAKNTGGHFWGSWKAQPDKKTGDRVVLSWWIPAAPLAKLIGRMMRKSTLFPKGNVPVNFGGKPCAKCGNVHRIEAIVLALGGWSWKSPTKLDTTKPIAMISDDAITALISRKFESQGRSC